jgi:hypothetical protein
MKLKVITDTNTKQGGYFSLSALLDKKGFTAKTIPDAYTLVIYENNAGGTLYNLIRD